LVSSKLINMTLKYRIVSIGSSILLLCLLWGCQSSPGFSREISGTVLAVDSTVAPQKDPAVDSIIGIYREQLEAEMNEVLAHSAHHMEKASPEGLLNNFVADLILEVGESLYDPEDESAIDFCLLNYGGLRTSLPEGPVTRGRVFELMPFENEMVVITLTAEKTRELFDYLALADRGMPVSGIQFEINEDRTWEAEIRGNPFTSRNYKVLTSDYLAGGGDNMTFFLDPLDEEYLDMRIRDAIIQYLQQADREGRKISSELDGRISQ